MLKSLRLVSENGTEVELQLNTKDPIETVEDVFAVKSRVYEDMEYEIFVNSDTEIDDASIFINAEPLEKKYIDDRGAVSLKEKKVFKGKLGFACFTIMLENADGRKEFYYSDYASILVRNSFKNDAVADMLRYIYSNQKDMLTIIKKRASIGRGGTGTYTDFWSQIILIENIASVYESCYGYFKVNSRYKLKVVETVDRVEKLQNIEAKTLSYMVSHPELLKAASSGIHYGGQTYLPNKTLMQQKQITQDIYENRVVLGFLETIWNESAKLKERIGQFIRQLVISDNRESDYVVSANLFYENARETLLKYLERISVATDRLEKLVMLYRGILNVRKIPCLIQPKPSVMFMQLPQYNRIYNCTVGWFSKTGYDFSKENTMVNFISIPNIYEFYVLVRMINQFAAFGFELIETKKIKYPKEEDKTFKSKGGNNMFTFRKGEDEVTLYYEPVIYDKDSRGISGIGLYRNNSISWKNESAEEIRQCFYLPDYVLKAVIDGKERYVICDAKYTQKGKVRTTHIPELCFKYMTSISPIDPETEIFGMNIFYGLTDSNTKIESFYDKKTGAEIKPYINIIPMSETMTEEQMEQNVYEIVRSLLKKDGDE